jgi:hypothetical protein
MAGNRGSLVKGLRSKSLTRMAYLSVIASISISYVIGFKVDHVSAADRPEASRSPSPPAPREVTSRKGPLKSSITKLAEFETAPFPYFGIVPATGKPFLDLEDEDRVGHSTPYGHIYWQEDVYNDSQVLLHIPKGFNIRKPAIMIVFFHGHGATLERDVLARQRVAEQVSKSGLNAVLVAPQMARDAADSSAGKFWEQGAFGRFSGEAAQALAAMIGDKKAVRTFAKLPVVVVAYSGGFQPAAWSLAQGGLGKRVKGVVLFDALYGELSKFKNWIATNRSGFFVSAYLSGTKGRNEDLARSLAADEIPMTGELVDGLKKGSVVFIDHGEDARHRDFVTNAWAPDPLADVLSRMKGFVK